MYYPVRSKRRYEPVDDPANDTNGQEGDMTLVTVEDAVRETGLAERTIRRWMKLGRLPFVRLGVGKKPPVRIRRRDLLRLVRPV